MNYFKLITLSDFREQNSPFNFLSFNKFSQYIGDSEKNAL